MNTGRKALLAIWRINSVVIFSYRELGGAPEPPVRRTNTQSPSPSAFLPVGAKLRVPLFSKAGPSTGCIAAEAGSNHDAVTGDFIFDRFTVTVRALGTYTKLGKGHSIRYVPHASSRHSA